MQRDTKQELLIKGHALALVHGLGYLTSKVMSDATGFYHFAVTNHYGSIAAFREAVKEYGVKNGTMAADLAVRCPRLSPADRKNEILDHAFDQAVADGLSKVTRASVATALGISDGLISRYFGTVLGLRDAVLAKAVVSQHVDVVADAIELDMNIHHVPPDLVSRAREILAA
jgi:Bacterial regulatory proteins, tetR family.